MKENLKRWFSSNFNDDEEEGEITFRVDFLPDSIPLKVSVDFDLNHFKPEKATSHKEIMKELFQEIVA